MIVKDRKLFVRWDYVNIAIVAIIAVLYRILLVIAVRPGWFADSGGYSVPFHELYYGYFNNIDGARTPIYPIFIGLIQVLIDGAPSNVISERSAEIVTLIQAALGVVSVVALYCVMRILNIDRRMAIIFSVLYSITSMAVAPERQLLPQAIETEFLIFTVCGVVLIVKENFREDKKRKIYIYSIMVGMLCAVTVLTRPDSLIFILVLLVGLLLFMFKIALGWRSQYAIKNIKSILVIFFIFLPNIILWMSFNYFNTGYFTITTLRGFVQTSSMRDMFGYVENEDKIIGYIINKRYNEIRNSGVHWPDYITSAYEEIVEKSSEMPIRHREPWFLGVDISDYMGKVSWKLIKKYPFDWLRNAFENFNDTFYFTSGMLGGNNETVNHEYSIKNKANYKLLVAVEAQMRPIVEAMYVMVVISVLYAVYWFARDNKKCFGGGDPAVLVQLIERYSVMLIGLGMLGSYVAYSLFACYLPRYGVSYIFAIYVVGAYVFDNITIKENDLN